MDGMERRKLGREKGRKGEREKGGKGERWKGRKGDVRGKGVGRSHAERSEGAIT
jgi:hypothetical protein